MLQQLWHQQQLYQQASQAAVQAVRADGSAQLAASCWRQTKVLNMQLLLPLLPLAEAAMGALAAAGGARRAGP